MTEHGCSSLSSNSWEAESRGLQLRAHQSLLVRRCVSICFKRKIIKQLCVLNHELNLSSALFCKSHKIHLCDWIHMDFLPKFVLSCLSFFFSLSPICVSFKNQVCLQNHVLEKEIQGEIPNKFISLAKFAKSFLLLNTGKISVSEIPLRQLIGWRMRCLFYSY